MSIEFTTRKCFSRLADGTRRNTWPPAALRPSSCIGSPGGRRASLAFLPLVAQALLYTLRNEGPVRFADPPPRSTNPPKLRHPRRPSAFRTIITGHSSPITAFPWRPRHARHLGRLIGTPRLGFRATHTKQSVNLISNRDTSGGLHSPSRTPFFLGAPFSRMAAFSPMRRPFVPQRRPAFPGCMPSRGNFASFLIANAGLENRLTPLRNTHLKISNREYMRILHPPWRIAVFQIGFYIAAHRYAGPSRHTRQTGPSRTRGPITRLLSLITAFRNCGLAPWTPCVISLPGFKTQICEIKRSGD